MIISHYNVIVLCRQLAPGLCVRCVAAYSWDDQQYDPCGTCTGRMSMPRPPPQHFYDYTPRYPHPSRASIISVASAYTPASVYLSRGIERFHDLRQRRQWDRKNNGRTDENSRELIKLDDHSRSCPMKED